MPRWFPRHARLRRPVYAFVPFSSSSAPTDSCVLSLVQPQTVQLVQMLNVLAIGSRQRSAQTVCHSADYDLPKNLVPAKSSPEFVGILVSSLHANDVVVAW